MDIRAIMSGQRKGPLAFLLRMVLMAVAPAYGLIVRLRNLRYDLGWAEIHRVDVPVVSIGNITTGGTGKTPTVAWIARVLRQKGIRVCIVSRGYRAGERGVNDEALELEDRLPDVPHLQNPDRVAAATVAVEELQTELILVDDGFQHRRLHRDLDIVLIDATCPFGFGHLLPRGLLREPLRGLLRAHIVVLSRADLIDKAQRQRIKLHVMRYALKAFWVEASHTPSRLIAHGGAVESLRELRGKGLLIVCAIGNPAAFYKTVDQLGGVVLDTIEFPDHHHFDRRDIDEIGRRINANPAIQYIVCTHKDLVKLRTSRIAGCPVYAVEIDMTITMGESALIERIESLSTQHD